jgi:multiple sugar transport system substrate-binding protein
MAPRHTQRSRRGRSIALLAIAAAASSSLLLSGCSAAGGAAPSDGYQPPAKDIKAEITYAFWDENQRAAIQGNVDAFNEEYPGIKVNLDVTPWGDYWTKIQTQASSDTLPDLFWLNGPNFQLYASNGKVEPITSIVDAGDIDPANYPEALVDLYKLDGVQYGVPKDFDTIGVWYNKDIFAQAGVDVPAADWTWDDFDAAASAISKALADKGIYGAAGGMDGQTTYYNTIFQAGGEVISADGTKSGYDSPEAEKGIQFWTDLIASGASPSMQQLTDSPADQWFTSGKLGMYWGGSWFSGALVDSDMPGKVGVLPLPVGAEAATAVHGVTNAVAAAGKNKQAAQALQVYLAGKDAQQQQGDLGAVIPAFTGTQTAFVDSFPGVDLQVFLDELSVGKPLPISKNTAAWNALETELLPDAFSGARPVHDVLSELAEKMNALLAKE